ncbi:UbiA family prenyltransferase [Nocardioides sp. URHA0020]|uniref:UbiA family prenyltransferase n=1 Tax=Nocardioides sp. URHA0020 TaxID=1380392 RepID=UPI00048E638C|nr:UbiA family prenyltransferase [Nocardioides sp. URHA0020]
MGIGRTARGLTSAAHPGPVLAVTVLAALLALSGGLGAADIALVTGAVLSGQLTVGWSNDLVDASRDASVGRSDKPIASGDVTASTVRLCCAVALVATVLLSLACGWYAGLVHLVLVASAWAYNLGLKSTWWSWAPYAVSFGGLPVFIYLAGDPATLPPLWLAVAAALLGVGAHLVNVLPDLADDEATGVRGLPHRLGAARTQGAAVVVLVAASLVVAGSATIPWTVLGPVLLLVGVLVAITLRGTGRTPFRAAIGIALVDVVMLVWS